MMDLDYTQRGTRGPPRSSQSNQWVSVCGHSFMLVSKQDGSITKEIQIPFKEKKSIVMRTKDETTGI